MPSRAVIRTGVVLTLVACPPARAEQPARAASLEAFLGTWHGRSTCVNRQVAPACKDEVVVYDVRRAAKADTATLKADKIVNGERLTMGELDFAYSSEEGCWYATFEAPRGRGGWCLKIADGRMTGTLRTLPERVLVREVELQRQEK